MRDRRFEEARRRLHRMLDTLQWLRERHIWSDHGLDGCPRGCVALALLRERIETVTKIIRDFGGRA